MVFYSPNNWVVFFYLNSKARLNPMSGSILNVLVIHYVLNNLNPVHKITPYLFQIYINIIFHLHSPVSSCLFLSSCPAKFRAHLSFSHACYIRHLFNFPSFDRLNNTRRRKQIKTTPILQSFSVLLLLSLPQAPFV